MARTSTGTGTVAPTAGTGSGPAAGNPPMTPAAALARHVEWLDFALGAATAEEAWRRDRLAKATKRNRAKREERLAEVVGEIEELTALIAGIRSLQQRAARSTRAKPGSTAKAPAADGTPRRRGRPRTTPLAQPSAPATPPSASSGDVGPAPARRRGRPRATDKTVPAG